jgi:rhodanese-related sulfurtransferase
MFWKMDNAAPLMKPEDLAQKMAEGQAPVIVDVRGPEQFRERHLPGAINIPLSELEARAEELDLTRPTVFY